jgi:iron complex transport system ATP-binding protein
VTGALRLDGLSVRYGSHVALAPLTEDVAPGEWLGVIGPNGAGKSSMLRAVAGLAAADGAVAAAGRPMSAMSDRERAASVAYVAQEPLIPDDMTTFDYVLLGRTPYIGYFGSATGHDRHVAATVIDRLELGPFSDRLLGTMSGGERQRVVLARALAQEATVLLLDEPTSALDIGHQQQALELVARLRREDSITVVAAMHDLTLAGTYADRLLMLDDGVVAARGAPRDVLTADRIGSVFRVCVSVDEDPDDGAVIVVPRRGFPA